MFIPQKSIKEEIESKLEIIDIYSFYLKRSFYRFPVSFNSPLREEKHKSFGLFIKNGNILWKDFTLNQGGDIYSLVAKMYGLSYKMAMYKIKEDMIDKKDNKDERKYNNISISKNTTTNIILTPYYYNDDSIPKSFFKYWEKYHISKETLIKNNVKAIKYLLYNYKLIETYTDKNIIIGYSWKRKGIVYHKIYFPFNRDRRFMSNFRGMSRYLVHGLDRIDLTKDYLIITKSVKDKMVLEELNYNAVSIQNEGITIPNEIVSFVKEKYKRIYLLYDNDYDKVENWGQIAAKKLISECGFINIKIDGRYGTKDISDFIEKYDIERTQQLINKLISEK